jgi:hypothetical protein
MAKVIVEFTFHELPTSRDRKRKNRISEPPRAFDTPLIVPLKNACFLCRPRPRYS